MQNEVTRGINWPSTAESELELVLVAAYTKCPPPQPLKWAEFTQYVVDPWLAEQFSDRPYQPPYGSGPLPTYPRLETYEPYVNPNLDAFMVNARRTLLIRQVREVLGWSSIEHAAEVIELPQHTEVSDYSQCNPDNVIQFPYRSRRHG